MRRDRLRYWSFDDLLSRGWGGIMIPLFLSMLCWSCASVNGEHSSGLIIGVVSPQRILQETVKGQQLSDTLNAFMKDRQALVELEQKELRNLEDELRAQVTILSQSARKLKEEHFRRKMTAYQQKVDELNREVQERQRELQNEFRREVEEVVKQIANERNLGLVLEHGANSGTMFHKKSWDISTDVIQLLNRISDDSDVP